MPADRFQSASLTSAEPRVTEDGADSPDRDSEVCSICFGTGTEVVPGKGARPCRCTSTNSRRRLIEAARIPRRYSQCSLDNFNCEPNTTQDIAFRYACRLVLDYPAVDRGLLFMGPVGVGKTHLAVAILRGLLEKGVPCLFYESGSLLKEIQDSYNPISKSSEMSVLAPVYQAEVLVLDELGSTVPTDWVRDTMYQIINTRYNGRKLTIFTTNYLDEVRIKPRDVTEGSEPAERQPARGKLGADRLREMTSLQERIGVRLRSRLYEMCTRVDLEGEDYRRRLDRRFDSARI
jgi:DNA replication protein DnaC